MAEYQGKPVMYIIDAEAGEPEPETRLALQQRLANRGDHAVLAIVRPGDLTLYPLNLDRETLNKEGVGKTIRASDSRAPFLFEQISTGALSELGGQSKSSDPVFEEIKTLLDKAVDELVVQMRLDGLAVLSMTGRALFFRFLVDRKIVTDDLILDICPDAAGDPVEHRLLRVFSSAKRAAQTSTWLDITFNGDLLPLIEPLPLSAPESQRRTAYENVYIDAGEDSGGSIFEHLEAILRGWEQTKGLLLRGIDWDDLKFRHIPIGVLSQVYENFSHRVNSEDSKDRSVHYTPRNLAKLLVEESLAGLETPAHQAKILDPACGAGVFLVLALRELVQRRWEADKARLGANARRPSKQVIEGILHNQIRGFDVSESALRLAALGLYITVIELNEITTPPSAHHATKALQGLVLFDQRTKEEKGQTGFVLGSLGLAVDVKKFDGVFDVVVGNPPWSAVTGNGRGVELDKIGTQVGRRVLKSRGLDSLASNYKNPGGVPDLPFLWRAAEWAKPGGILGFALDARFILKQTPAGVKTRNAWFQAMRVTGILNGSDLEETAVWKGMKMPWILLWSRNEKPDLDSDAFHLVTPIREDELAQKHGEFRLDYKSAHQVTVQSVIDLPWLCKALAIGSILDVQVMEKMCSLAKVQNIKDFWKSNQLSCGNGFSLKRQGKKTPPEWLNKLPAFNPNDEKTDVPIFSSKTFGELYPSRLIESPRVESLYSAPLLIIPESLGSDSDATAGYRITEKNICFSKSYFGYSGAGHSQPLLVVSLLSVFVNSTLFRHFCYLRSSRIGAGRRTIYKSDIDSFPFPKPENLTDEQQTEALRLADMLDAPTDTRDWKALDTFVGSLFGLTKAEQQVVEDTVNFNGPYRVVREQAMLSVPKNEASAFVQTLERAIQPFFKAVGQKIQASLVPRLEGDWRQPWAFVTLLPEGDPWKPSTRLIASLIAEASASSATRLVMPLPEGGVIIGLLNKRRFWTKSRARLCAMHIAERHLKSFPPPEKK
ncbi:MAG: N-6 DNA methylase [Verrucomicrobiales bacterium]